jgi:hypothetical protein
MPESDVVTTLRRWEEAGGIWRVLARRPKTLTIALCRCDGGEEVDRFTSDSPELIAYVGARAGSED